MEPLTTTLLTALVTGAAAATTTVAGQAIKDAYAGLKQLISNTFSAYPAVAIAVQQVDDQPDSQGRQGFLKGELETALATPNALPEAAQQALRTQAQTLLALLAQLQAAGPTSATYHATLSGSGAIAQDHSTAAGAGGIAVGGSVSGSHLITGSGNVVSERHSERQVNTGGGAAIEGNVSTGGGAFSGRDQKS